MLRVGEAATCNNGKCLQTLCRPNAGGCQSPAIRSIECKSTPGILVCCVTLGVPSGKGNDPAHKAHKATATMATSRGVPGPNGERANGRAGMPHMSVAEEQEHPETCCSNCQTVFEVSVDLLASSDTRVRCGECMNIFDALLNLRQDDQFHEDDDFLVDGDGNILEPAHLPRALLKEELDGLDDADDGADADEDEDEYEEEVASVPSSAGYHKASALSDAGAAALAGLGNDTSSLDVTYSDFSLFSEDAELPEVAFFDQTQDEAAYEYDEYDDDETLSDSLFSRDMTIDMPESTAEGTSASDLTAAALQKEVDFVTNDMQRDPIVFNYRDKEPAAASATALVVAATTQKSEGVSDMDSMIERVQSGTSMTPAALPAPKTGRSPWVLRSSLAVLVFLLAALLYGYKERSALFASPSIRPVLIGLCSWLSCEVPALKDVGSFKIVKRAAFSHPSLEEALIVDLAFVNEAKFTQPYPELELQLTDITGRLVVVSKFSPADYLDSWSGDDDELGIAERVNVKLTVEDPGRNVTSFVVRFH